MSNLNNEYFRQFCLVAAALTLMTTGFPEAQLHVAINSFCGVITGLIMTLMSDMSGGPPKGPSAPKTQKTRELDGFNPLHLNLATQCL